MNKLNITGLTEELQEAIKGVTTAGELVETGVVTRISDGVIWIYGLKNCGFGEVVEISTTQPKAAQALVLSLGEDEIGAVILGDDSGISAGAKVKLLGHSPSVPVGPELRGRVIDPLGRPLDGLGPIKAKKNGSLEHYSPTVMDRRSVFEPLSTGIMAIDTMTPIGRGQRQLIIGDRKTGKTAIAIDTIVNQSRQEPDMTNIYVAIGQKSSTVAALIERLKSEGAMEHSVVVATSPADSAALLYLAPYTGTAIGEYFRDNGQHALIVYDDLSKHAISYRQLSLLLRRPPGREAYPGDVFYLHSRLLERSAKLSDELGGGSLTALPIIETQAGDVSAYIPTNVISITDGQIYLESDLFYQGVRPAISVGLSVSRVGGAAQTKGLKSVAGSLRVELAQYRELAAFAQFGSDLDEDTQERITRGRILTETLKQKQYQPLSSAEQIVILSPATAGVFDHVPPDQLADIIRTLLDRVHTDHARLLQVLADGNKPTVDMMTTINELAEQVVKLKIQPAKDVK